MLLAIFNSFTKLNYESTPISFEKLLAGFLDGMTIKRGPNPWFFVALSLSSFAVFVFVIRKREKTNPASL